MKVCFGIICIGRTYIAEFEKLFKPSVAAYCQKYGYDLKIFTDFLDPTRKHADTISFQKCLVPSFLTEYDLVVILDADIYIEPNSPPIHVFELNGKIGMVNEISQLGPEQYKKLNEVGFVDYGKEYYAKCGFELETNKILNTGVMLCNPVNHSKFLESIYNKYIGKCIGHTRGFHYEQSCIGYEIQTSELFTLIPNVWNFIYLHPTLIGLTVGPAYFVHFAGMRGSQREIALARHTTKHVIRWGIKK
jgi:hypothetical protein